MKSFDQLVRETHDHAKTMPSDNGWFTRHEKAFQTTIGFHGHLVGMLRSTTRYAEEHLKRYESPISDDGFLGDYILDQLKACRALLNGEIGNLDGGTMDRLIRSIAAEHGFDADSL